MYSKKTCAMVNAVN